MASQLDSAISDASIIASQEHEALSNIQRSGIDQACALRDEANAWKVNITQHSETEKEKIDTRIEQITLEHERRLKDSAVPPEQQSRSHSVKLIFCSRINYTLKRRSKKKCYNQCRQDKFKAVADPGFDRGDVDFVNGAGVESH